MWTSLAPDLQSGHAFLTGYADFDWTEGVGITNHRGNSIL